MTQWFRTECNMFPLNVKEWGTLGWISWSGLAVMTKFFRPKILQDRPRMCYQKFLKTFLFHVKRPFISHSFQCFLRHLTGSDALLTNLWFLLPAPAQLNGKDGRRVLGCNAWDSDFEVLTASRILLFSVFLTLCQSFYHSSKLLTNLLALCTLFQFSSSLTFNAYSWINHNPCFIPVLEWISIEYLWTHCPAPKQITSNYLPCLPILAYLSP